MLNIPAKSLGDFNRQFGRDWVLGYISMWLIELNDNSNVKTKMSDGQMDFTAERIFDTYSLKVTDLTLFFRNVKEGKYGPYYENLSQDKIMSWLAEYWEERCEYAEMSQQQRHDKFSLSKDKINPEVAAKMFEGVGEEPVDHTGDGNGIGGRTKAFLSKGRNAGVLDKLQHIRTMTLKELRDYIINTNAHDEGFDAYFFEMVEREIDIREKLSK